MCQPLPPLGNGKRCLKHASATKAEIIFSWAKTKVDKENIYAILKQLNKEGRKLDAPELAEVKEFLDKEEFKVKLDPDLSERDRKMILKNLAKARDEAEEQGVTGGAFHAWKNVFKETVAKMKKPLVAFGLAGVLLVGISGCAGSLNNDNNPITPDPTDSGPVACSTENPGEYGDVIGLEDVTDEYGTYCHTTIDPASTALVYDSAKVDVDSLTEFGFTEEDAAEAQKTAVKIYAEQILDSTRLDNYKTAAPEWFKANSEYIAPEWRTEYQKMIDGDPATLGTSGVIVTDILPTPLARDGGARASSTAIQVNKIYAVVPSQGVPNLVVSMGSTSTYYANESSIVESALKNNPAQTEESLKASNPELFDGNEDNFLILNGKTLLGFGAGNNSQVIGSSSIFTLYTNNDLTLKE